MVDVNSSRCNVSGHEYRNCPCPESSDGMIALVLGLVAVESDSEDALASHVGSDAVAGEFCPYKHDGATVACRNAGGRLVLDVRRHVEDHVAHRGGTVVAAGDVVQRRVGHVR